MLIRAKQKGVSLIELVVVITVMATLVGLAAPAVIEATKAYMFYKGDVNKIAEVQDALASIQRDLDYSVPGTFRISGKAMEFFVGSTSGQTKLWGLTVCPNGSTSSPCSGGEKLIKNATNLYPTGFSAFGMNEGQSRYVIFRATPTHSVASVYSGALLGYTTPGATIGTITPAQNMTLSLGTPPALISFYVAEGIQSLICENSTLYKIVSTKYPSATQITATANAYFSGATKSTVLSGVDCANTSFSSSASTSIQGEVVKVSVAVTLADGSSYQQSIQVVSSYDKTL